MNLKKISQLLKDIEGLDHESFKQFHLGYISVYKRLRHGQLNAFRPGDIVEFQGRKIKHGGAMIRMRVHSIGRSRLIGYQLDLKGKTTQMRWRVSPGLCTKVEEKELTS